MSVYFVRTIREPRIKVGFSSNVASRIKGLQTAASEHLHLIGYMDGDHSAESRIHEALRNYHIRGEWFHLDPTVEAFVKCCIKNNGIDVALTVYRDYLAGNKRSRVLYCESVSDEFASIINNPESTTVDYQKFLINLGASVRTAKRLARYGWRTKETQMDKAA